MNSTLIASWKLAQSPNYSDNVDKEYPYSEVPYLGEYKLVKIPHSPDSLVSHVDYWGEGKITTAEGVSGFADCYNVNHPYQLVSNGSDRNRKIPNRISVLSYTKCDTSAYIKDNSVSTVTLMGAPINTSCAVDIGRMVNDKHGKVVVYGFHKDSKDIVNLTAELQKKAIYLSPSYKLPNQLRGLTLFNNHLAFLGTAANVTEMYNLVTDGFYDEAVNMCINLNNNIVQEAISDLVEKLLLSNTTTKIKLISFAYKLWTNGGKNLVQNYFPHPLKLIYNEDKVCIINKAYNQALKLGVDTDYYGDRIVWSDNSDRTSNNVSWKLIPVWANNDVTFKLYNVNYNMYMKLDVTADSIGDRQAWGSDSSNEDRHRYYIEPNLHNGSIIFYIINYRYHQGLKLELSSDNVGERRSYGHEGDIHKGEDRFKWIISAW